MIAQAQITIADLNDPIQQGEAPASPVPGMLWLDTSSIPNLLRRWDGTNWVECSADVDLSEYYTKSETNTLFEQTNNAIALKADSATVSSLGERLDAAEQKVTPEAIASTVTSSAMYAYEKYAGRNYCLNSGIVHTFVDNKYHYANGTVTNSTSYNLNVSDDLFSHSNNASNIRISFDIKRTDVDASASSSTNVYSGIWVYYHYIDSSGSSLLAGRGWYLRTTDSTFAATDDDWVRVSYGPLNLSSFNPTAISYFALGTGSANGTTGTVQFRNIKLEVLNSWTEWSAAPEDIYGLANRVTNAESKITQNANSISLKVSTSTYNSEKVYRGATAPSGTMYMNMLWLDTSVSPNLLKRYDGSNWIAAGAQEVKSSGIYIGDNNVSITTENFLLQLLDPANNENVLMEMSADGNVGFKELYADRVISESIAAAYDGPTTLYVNPSYSGTSNTYFRSLGEAVQAVNNRFLREDVWIWLPSGTDIYEPNGVHIKGVSGTGHLCIRGYSNNVLNSYITVRGCSAHIRFVQLFLRESRPKNGNSRNPYLVECAMDQFVEFNSCTLDANDVTYDSVYCKTSHVWLYQTNLYNALQG